MIERTVPLGNVQIHVYARAWRSRCRDTAILVCQTALSALSLFAAYFAAKEDSGTQWILVSTAGTMQLFQVIFSHVIPRYWEDI